MTESERLDRIEAIMRANRMHELRCPWLQYRRSSSYVMDPGMPNPEKCDCWLSQP